jgi:hypothetical protein
MVILHPSEAFVINHAASASFSEIPAFPMFYLKIKLFGRAEVPMPHALPTGI